MSATTANPAATVICGLNAALQKRFILPAGKSLIPGDVHRADQVQTGLGGKGQDVAMTLSCLGFTGNLQLAQFVGSGAAGDTVYGLVTEAIGEQAMECTVRTKSSMRTCTSIVTSESTTELVEPSGVISDEDNQDLFDRLSKFKADAICVMGSMPPGCPEDTYAKIYETVADKGALCLIDSVVGLEPLLKSIDKSGKDGQAILKINASELCRLSGVDKKSSEAGGVQTEEVVSAVKGFLQKFHPFAQGGLSAFAITDGAHPAYFVTMPKPDKDEKKIQLFRLPVSKIESGLTLYPIGAGDSVAGGTLAAWKSMVLANKADNDASNSCVPDEVRELLDGPSSTSMLRSFAFGLACGTASCLKEENSVLELSDVKQLYEQGGQHEFVSSHDI
eukprot:CAMPEP_0198137534 /NCGR_PEP_ID=MMETSP1443-20131203/998_1 /TAXON_ID=186043 /ORGANISM="Entomoneis sp., Strain CCMP2396" /LENGTH=389 /DNA_ID=CAMNT_0043798987 /DNA_START=120 /DNA_END=1289 /DNA_ORIENTATION=-